MSRGVFLRATGTAMVVGPARPALWRAAGLATDGAFAAPDSAVDPATWDRARPGSISSFPARTAEPSLITNMQGRVGVANVAGMGWRVDHAAGTRGAPALRC